MIELQIVSPVKKYECAYIVKRIVKRLFNKLDFGINSKIGNENLPIFERELNAHGKVIIDFTIPLTSLRDKKDYKLLRDYYKYQTSFYFSFNPDLKPVWSNYCGKQEGDFLGIVINDNLYSDEIELKENELKLLYNDMKKASRHICNELRILRKNYLFIDRKSGRLIEISKIS